METRRDDTGIRGPARWITSSGLIDERYRVQNLIQRAGLDSYLRAWRRQPLTPIYWVVDTFSYKSYLLLSHNFVESWPAADRPLPAWEAGLLQWFASQRYGEAWEPERGVIQSSGHKRLKEGVAAIDEASLRHPDIRFFAERDPHHARGDLLLCLAPLSLRNWNPFWQGLCAGRCGLQQGLDTSGQPAYNEQTARGARRCHEAPCITHSGPSAPCSRMCPHLR